MNLPQNKIKNIIFDLGGIIINIDYNILIQAFSKIGLPHFEAYFSQKEQKGLFDSYEKGHISSQDFRNELKKQCNPGTSDEAIDNAWNSMILNLPKERLDLLIQLKNTYRTFLLSNTNEIHMLFIENYLKKQFQLDNLNSHFEKVYLSYLVNMRKPDAEIFNLVIQENNLTNEETLFIDDSVQHIKSAKALGIQTVWLDVQKESVLDYFRSPRWTK